MIFRKNSDRKKSLLNLSRDFLIRIFIYKLKIRGHLLPALREKVSPCYPYSIPNFSPCASGSSDVQFIVFVCRRM